MSKHKFENPKKIPPQNPKYIESCTQCVLFGIFRDGFLVARCSQLDHNINHNYVFPIPEECPLKDYD